MPGLGRWRKWSVVRYSGEIRLLATTRTDLLIYSTIFAGAFTGFPCRCHIIPLSKLAIQRALIQGQQIVVPTAICMGTKIRSFPRFADYTDVGSFAVDRIKHVECVGLVVDTLDHPFSFPHPVPGRIAEMRDVFVRTLRVRLQNASYLYVSHAISFLSCLRQERHI